MKKVNQIYNKMVRLGMSTTLNISDYYEILMYTVYKKLNKDGKIRRPVNHDFVIGTTNLGKTTVKLVEEIINDQPVDEIRDAIRLVVTGGRRDSSFDFVSSISEISELVVKLLEIKDLDVVCDFGSGFGSFLSDVNSYCHENNIILKDLFGLEVNEQAAIISKYVLSILDVNKMSIISQNILYGTSVKCNKGYCFPPIGLKFYDEATKKACKRNRYNLDLNGQTEWLFVDKMLDSLSLDNKRAVALLPENCLYKAESKEYRDNLIKDKLIEGIIELPNKFSSVFGFKMCLVIFSENNDTIKFIDLNSIDEEKQQDDNEIYKLYKEDTGVASTSCFVLSSFLPSTVLLSERLNLKGNALSDVSEVFAGCQYTINSFKENLTIIPSNFKILTSSDINNGTAEWQGLQNIDNSEGKFDKFKKYGIKKNDIVVTAKSSKVKTCLVDFEPKDDIIVTGGMIIIRPDTKKIDPVFLQMYLESEKGRGALKLIQKGSSIITINATDLRTILIPKVELSKQKEFALKYKTKKLEILKLQHEILEQEKSIQLLCEATFASRKDKQ